jgi:hypothetical protein
MHVSDAVETCKGVLIVARVEKSVLEGLVDEAEAAFTYRQPQPERVDVAGGIIRVRYGGFFDAVPLESADLFTAFARLAAHGAPSERRIERWVSRHGLPVWGARRPVSMSVEDFRHEARDAHGLLHLYLELRGEDAPAIRSRSKCPDSPFDREFAEAYRAARHEWRLYSGKGAKREVRDAATLLAARAALGGIISALVSGVRLRAGVQRGLTPSYEVPDLPSAMYLQFYLLATQSRPLRPCEYCGTPFEATRRDKAVCGPSCRSGLRYKRRKS